MKITRREFLKALSGAAVGSFAFPSKFAWSEGIQALPMRPLGQTGIKVTQFGLGGEGILRTYGQEAMAEKVIKEALKQGVGYFDTSPAYAGSLDYYGQSLGSAREKIFLASKTHDRTHQGSLKLLEESLSRLKTTYLDLWQLHDLRTREDLEAIFSGSGAIHALEEARKEGKVKFLGITGHYDPEILVEALGRFPFDTVLCALNIGDKYYRSFLEKLVPVAQKKGVGIIGMKVLARGNIFQKKISLEEAMFYVLSLPVSTLVIGCSTPEEVRMNVEVANQFKMLSQDQMQELEEKVRHYANQLNFYKR